jgi:hypothetical protein
MAKQRVEVVRGWSGGPYGSKEPTDSFDYDLDADPEKLSELGLVKKAAAKAATDRG